MTVIEIMCMTFVLMLVLTTLRFTADFAPIREPRDDATSAHEVLQYAQRVKRVQSMSNQLTVAMLLGILTVGIVFALISANNKYETKPIRIESKYTSNTQKV